MLLLAGVILAAPPIPSAAVTLKVSGLGTKTGSIVRSTINVEYNGCSGCFEDKDEILTSMATGNYVSYQC